MIDKSMIDKWKLRLVSERAELANRGSNLAAFMEDDEKTGEVSDVQLRLLKMQLAAMTVYLEILNMRIFDADESLMKHECSR